MSTLPDRGDDQVSIGHESRRHNLSAHYFVSYAGISVTEARQRMAHVMPEIIYPLILIGVFLLIAMTIRMLDRKQR